ncbi:MAG: valine--tRNA ligase [Firmicutes bacterium]|nr:valine--tRNA ligase [Bacillota bacterium]
MARDFPKTYEPQPIEQRWSGYWYTEQLFRVDPKAPGPVFSIVIPPPNVTGSIHIGHMLEHTQIDTLVRWRRMQGYNTLWLPGTDHAGIATQVVVERRLAAEGLQRQQLGREAFERRVWEWKAESGNTIKKQMIRLGDSCDWSRERFTLEPALYRAVLEAFLRLYHEGLIYRGRYMVNWCPRCQTALSDLEVSHQERAGKLWYLRYPVLGSGEHITVATTRPETMLGDTAVAVHPDDERYRHLIGRRVLLPLMEREIPILADPTVDREFGTGAVKVTPAHDPNDFALGQRHHLPEVEVITEDGHMSEAAGRFAGLDRFAARERIVAELRELGLLERIADYTHAVGLCDRCKTVVEPRLSLQWFCRMKPLAEPAIQVVREGLIPIVPENWKAVYLDWMERIHDWCISRQLWWGHRIPVWHCADCAAMTPARSSAVAVTAGCAAAADPPERCARCGSRRIEQDPDVLDTWFSSALWPLSTLGWPDETEDLRTFYPTSLLISGYDILFFWDARMIMFGLKFAPGRTLAERIPFRQLYLHQLVRDPEGVKMSKTRGNVIDPLEVIERHGTDALRFTLVAMAAPGTDIALSEERILGYRAFANKIWNAARFLFFNLEKIEALGVRLEELASPAVRAAAPYRTGHQLPLADRWIFSRLGTTVAEVNAALEEFRFHEAAHAIYHFFWGDFCDWYVEWVKPALIPAADTPAAREAAVAQWRNLFAVFDCALRLLHPVMPFITEELWHRLPQRQNARSIALERFPTPPNSWRDAAAEVDFTLLQEIIAAARNLRAELKLEPKRKVAAEFSPATPDVQELVAANLEPVLRLAGLASLQVVTGPLATTPGVVRSTAQFDLRIAYSEAVDLAAERHRLDKELERLRRDIAAKRQRLADATFRARAPERVVRDLETALREREVEYRKLADRLAQLGGAEAPATK